MTKFGEIKSKIEDVLIENYRKDDFKSFLKGFKKHVLSNKRLLEAYYLYDNLSSKNGFSNEVADVYIELSVDRLKKIVNEEYKKISELNEWVNKKSKRDVVNNYKDIDVLVYTNSSVKNLEKLAESSLNIKKLVSNKSDVKETKTVNLPLSSMIKVATNIFNNKYSNITESEKNELNSLLSLDKKSLKTQINESKETVINKLKNSLTESQDKELNDKIQETINKIIDSDISFLTLYRIKELEKEL